VTAGFLGFFPYLWRSDVTKLSFIALGIFTVMNVFVGLLCAHSRDGDQHFVKHLPFCWFMSEFLMGIGMAGTLIGFLVLLNSAFGGTINLADAVATQKILSSMAVGFATAGLTTLVGLSTSLLLKLQLTNLEYALDE
jgi:hypothetical protein